MQPNVGSSLGRRLQLCNFPWSCMELFDMTKIWCNHKFLLLHKIKLIHYQLPCFSVSVTEVYLCMYTKASHSTCTHFVHYLTFCPQLSILWTEVWWPSTREAEEFWPVGLHWDGINVMVRQTTLTSLVPRLHSALHVEELGGAWSEGNTTHTLLVWKFINYILVCNRYMCTWIHQRLNNNTVESVGTVLNKPELIVPHVCMCTRVYDCTRERGMFYSNPLTQCKYHPDN